MATSFNNRSKCCLCPTGRYLWRNNGDTSHDSWEDDEEIEQFGILDLTESIRFGGEEGLLSMALHPDLQNDPYLYVYYSPQEARVTRLSRFRLVLGSALHASELVIIEVPQPYSNHNGGAVRFGPDGMLYLGFGDGGAANDPQGNGQNRETLLGTIIRIDVNGIDTSTPYLIPSDNPFLGIAGVRPEIWAWGLRNPWRMAFDSETGRPLGRRRWSGSGGGDRNRQGRREPRLERVRRRRVFPLGGAMRGSDRRCGADRDIHTRRGLLGDRVARSIAGQRFPGCTATTSSATTVRASFGRSRTMDLSSSGYNSIVALLRSQSTMTAKSMC